MIILFIKNEHIHQFSIQFYSLTLLYIDLIIIENRLIYEGQKQKIRLMNILLAEELEKTGVIPESKWRLQLSNGRILVTILKVDDYEVTYEYKQENKLVKEYLPMFDFIKALNQGNEPQIGDRNRITWNDIEYDTEVKKIHEGNYLVISSEGHIMMMDKNLYNKSIITRY